jgi:protein-S-isoprenylcysteine O-methyltransferase Ste14
MIFVPAGSFHFWQGWVFIIVFAVFNGVFVGYFYKRDPALLERRLKNKETRGPQRVFKVFWVPLWLITLLLPGFDYRFGWSEALGGGVPMWLMIGSVALIVVAWLIVFYVMRYNSYASAVVQIEAGQKVITDGPYRLVRHPMYSGFILMIVAAPLQLGSYVALVPALLLIPLLILRLLDEERALRQELPGYAEYCARTRFRLIPSVF